LKKQIFVNVDIDIIRIAILEDGRLCEYYEEKDDCERIVGNIYKGKVRNILPGMQSAFIDVGIEKDVFMHVEDVYIPEFIEDEEIFEECDIELSKVESEKPLEDFGVFIEELLSVDEDIIVQITKEPIGTKGARGTAHLTIAGRYTVLMPNQNHVGVSRKITDEEERSRLKEIGKELCPDSMGVILRTVSGFKEKEKIEEDIRFLNNLWKKIERRAQNINAPCLIYSDLEMVLKLVRDIFLNDIDEFLIDSYQDYQKIIDFFDFLPEELISKIKYYSGSKPLFEKNSIEKSIEKLLNRTVQLKCGGYIIIEKTEALTAIDVNTGSYVGNSQKLEETVFRTNLEAAVEIARQLRLRDIGGIIIIDFIDMKIIENQNKLVEVLKEECVKDKMPITISDISELGLVEMTRKRVRKSLLGQITQPCPYCKGKGYVLSPQEISSKVRRDIRRFSRKTLKDNVLVSVHPEVGFYLIGEDEVNLSRMEYETRKKIYIRTEKDFHVEQFIIS